MPLFERGGLQQDTGLLSERWNQEGSEPKTVSSTQVGNGTDTAFTVTAGKVFYLKSLTFYSNAAGTQPVPASIKDNGTIKIYIATSVDYQSYSHEFPSPVKFSTNVQLTHGNAGCTYYYTVVGWEEDA